jgi:hypothetical protein
MREAERCTDVTNAVVGEADGAAVLVERTPPLIGGRGDRQVRLGRGPGNCERSQSIGAEEWRGLESMGRAWNK